MPGDLGDGPVTRSDTPSKAPIIGVILLLSTVGVVWFFRPWLHGLVYWLYTTPLLWIGLPVCAGIGLLVTGRFKPNAAMATVAACVIGLLLLTTAAGTFATNTLGHATMEDSQPIDQLRDTDASQPRVLPQSVADRYASNTLNFPRYQASEGDITIHNGTPHWSYALSPDGIWNHLTKQQHGTVMVDMTSQNTAVTTTTGDLQKGIGTVFFNNYEWHLLKHGKYLANYEDPYMVMHDDQQYIAVPYTEPQFHWLPLPHTTPEWGGVMLIDDTGEITDLTPDEARQHEALEDQKLYPFDLTRKKVASTKYRNGILNTYTAHDEEIELAPVPGEGNEQPFLTSTTEGPTYVVAVEPYGDAQGLNEIWLVDARTGQQYRYAPNESVFGPRKATDYVRQAARTTDWDRFTPAEPLPVIIDDQLYWQVRVIPNDNSGLSYIAFVNAHTSEVQEVEMTATVEEFLQNGDVPDNQTTERTETESTTTPPMIVQRVGPNGTVRETVTVHKNESIRIDQQNDTANVTTS